MKKQVPLTALIAASLVIVLVVGYIVLIKPERDRGAKLDEEIANLDETVAALEAADRNIEAPGVQIEYADLFRLAKAMPDREDMPGILLEIDSVANSSGVDFLAIAPSPATSNGLYRVLPISLTFDGNYYDLTDFLYRLRSLVTVRNGTLNAAGRLYTLDGLDLHESQEGFPRIEAVLTLHAYVFGADPLGAVVTPAPTSPAGGDSGETEESGNSPETGDAPQEPPGPEPASEATEPSEPPPAPPTTPGGAEALGENR